MGIRFGLLYVTESRAYIPTIEEMLLDFQELIGEHSGENMADVVWSTLEEYGLLKKVPNLYIFFLYQYLTTNGS